MWFVPVAAELRGITLKINTDQYLPGEGVLVSLVDASKSISPPPVIVMENPAHPGDLNQAPLQVGESFNDPSRNINISVVGQSGNNYNVRIQYKFPPGGKPDPMIIPWGAPPYETEDIWIDSQQNGWGNYRYTDGSGNPIGNGDDAWVNRDNRVYVKIHNTGTAPASNIRVEVFSNSPPGMGDAGHDWSYLGTIVFPFIPAGGSAQDYVIWQPTVGIHTCIKAIILPYPGELSESNNYAQENVDHFDTTSHSPFQPVLQKITVYNPSKTNSTPVHFNVRDIPPGWATRVEPTDMILPKGGNDTVTFEVFPSGPPGASPNESKISELALRSYSSLTLSRESTLTIAGGLKFYVSDTPDNDIRFYPAINRERGAVSQLISPNTFSATKWDAMNFPALLYDINNNRSTETLFIDQGAFSNRTIAEENLWYKTGRSAQKYKVFENKGSQDAVGPQYAVENGLDKNLNKQLSGGYYALVGWFGERYVAINGNVNKLSRIILDQDDSDKKVLSVGESWDMGDGWVLTVNAVDARTSPRTVWFTISKDGAKFADSVANQGQVYTFSQDLSNEKNVPVFVTYIDAIFAGATTDMVQFRYSWLISNSIMELKAGDKFGVLEVVNEFQSPGFTGKPKIEAYIPFEDTFIPIGGVESWAHLVNTMDINCRVNEKEIRPYVIIQGQLSPPIENALVSVEFIQKDMREVMFARTDPKGFYSVKFLPNDNGLWQSQAFFSGDNKYEAAESNDCKFEAIDLLSISGKKLNDINGNQKVDPGDEGLPNWTIQLTKPDGTTVTTKTDSNGSYIFKGLIAGKYVVEERLEKGWIKIAPSEGTYAVTLEREDVTGKDFLNSKTSVPSGDFFYSDDKMVPVTIAVDQLGIVARDGVTSSQLEEFASRFKLKLIHEYPQGIFIFGLSGNFTRPEIVNLARTIQSDGANLVTYAGFTATPRGAETPFIVSDEFIAQFDPDITREQIDSLNKENSVEIVMQDRFARNQFLLKVTENSRLDALSMANIYHRDNLIKFSHPNFVRVIDFRQVIPNDPFFGNQWSHKNTGQAGGTVDADVDTPFAWDITRGNAGTIIAVIDEGFDMTHPDLTPNLWVNPGEIAGNGLDDDNNGFIDDVNGFDFRDNDSTINPADHGTHTAGIAAARGNNSIGISGSCPTCSLMLIRTGFSVFDDAQAFGYAQMMGAQIITNSWGYSIGTPTTTAVVNAINNTATGGRGGLGSVILFAMNNPNVNDCGAIPDISSLANVIAVSRSTNKDQFDFSGFGNCMDVLAPGVGIFSTLIGGYGNLTGTSMATPLVAGTSGLILSVNPGLTRLQVQELLQDTADKIQDSAGNYDPNTGFSAPAAGAATHGWGRINALEAVRVAAPVAQGGKGGVDIFLRDNRLDWGNTEQPSNTLFESPRGYIGHWQSMDIKIDAPPYQPAPTAATFDTFVDETPSAVAGDINRVYVRVRNRGPVMASVVTIKLHWTQFGTALPALPGDFWTAFPADSSDTTRWHPLKCGGTTSSTCNISNLAYSGSSVATTGAGAAQVVTFDFPAPPVETNLSNHFCLIAMIDSPQDPISSNSRNTFVVDDITPGDNNVAHRNYFNLNTSRSRDFVESFFVRNPTDRPLRTVLRVRAPEHWKIELDKFAFDETFTLEPNQEVLVTMQVDLPGFNQDGEVAVTQEQMDSEKPKVMGGVIYRFVSELGEISGMKFNDLNNNSMKDTGESGLDGWTINLKDSNGNIVASNKTDNNGSYVFSELAAGNYTVEEVLQANWTQTFPEAPGVYNVTIAAGEKVKGKNFGNFRISLSKGDLNNNGLQADAGDLVLMKRASIGEIPTDSGYDLNNNGQFADAGDLVLMKRASIGEIRL